MGGWILEAWTRVIEELKSRRLRRGSYSAGTGVNELKAEALWAGTLTPEERFWLANAGLSEGGLTELQGLAARLEKPAN